MRTNYAAEINRIIENYINYGMGIEHGLQKDNIQNSWGARTIKKGTGFAMTIEVIEEPDFVAVTFTDKGTEGLTGTIYNNLDEVEDDIDFSDPNKERLANFETHKNVGISSEEQRTGGFIGQGKLISNLHSNNYRIYYDSLRSKDDKYLLNTRYFDPPNLNSSHMRIYLDDVKWNEEAQEKIKKISKGHLTPLENSGTRIIIIDPTDELIKYIKSGDMLEHIQDTWWELLMKYPIEGIFVKHSGEEYKAECSDFFQDAFEEGEDKIVIINQTVAGFGRIKKAVFGFADEKLPNRYNGLTIQRAQMPINQSTELYGTPFSIDIPNSHKDKFYGIITLDNDLEGAIRPLEHETHYTFNPRPTRNFQLYDRFRTTIIDHGIEPLKRLHGLSATGEDTSERARKIAKQTRKDINELFKENGVAGGIKRADKKKFIVSAKSAMGIKNPNLLGDSIKITFQVKNRSNRTVSSNIKIETYDEENRKIETLFNENDVELVRGKNKILPEVDFNLDPNKYENGIIYKVLCSADIDSEIYSKEEYIYINRKKESKSLPFNVEPNIEKWPQNNHRVDTDEQLEGITCLVSSNILEPVKVYLDVQLYNKVNNRKLNGKIFQSEVCTIEPNGTELIDNIPNVVLDDMNTDGIGEGEIFCRFSLRVAEEYGDNKIGDQISKNQRLIYFNCDPPGAGIFEEVIPRPMGADNYQAIVEVNNETSGYICVVNSDHRSYNTYYHGRDDNKYFECYMKDLTIRQGLLTCIEYDMPEIFDDRSSLEGLDNIDLDKMVNKKHGELLNILLRDS